MRPSEATFIIQCGVSLIKVPKGDVSKQRRNIKKRQGGREVSSACILEMVFFGCKEGPRSMMTVVAGEESSNAKIEEAVTQLRDSSDCVAERQEDE